MYSGKIAFAQLTYRENLRDIGACPRARNSKLYHGGIRARGHRGRVSRNTLANANEKRDRRIHADFAEAPIAIARRLYAQDGFGVELGGAVYALDSTTIDLCLAGFPRAPFMRSKAAVTLHTPLPCWICGAISPASSISPIAGGTMSGCSTSRSRKPAPSPSWSVAISTSRGSTARPGRAPCSSSAPRENSGSVDRTTVFEKTPRLHVFSENETANCDPMNPNQSTLFH